MNKKISTQNKKSLRLRALRLFKDLQLRSKYKIQMVFVGSMAKGGGEVSIDKEGSYDLDFDIIGKFEQSADETYKYFEKLIGDNLRSHEHISIKDRVIRISISEMGQKYNYDIAIKKFFEEDHSKVQTMIKKDNKFVWSNPAKRN